MITRRLFRAAAVPASIVAVGLGLIAVAAPASAATTPSDRATEARIVDTNVGPLQWELEDEEPW